MHAKPTAALRMNKTTEAPTMTNVLSHNAQRVALFAASSGNEQQILPSMFASTKVMHHGNSLCRGQST